MKMELEMVRAWVTDRIMQLRGDDEIGRAHV